MGKSAADKEMDYNYSRLGSEQEQANLNRELQKYLQNSQQQFESGESRLSREFQGQESDKSRELQKYLQQIQNQFSGSESQKSREFEQGIFNQKVGLNKGYGDLGSKDQEMGEQQFLNQSSEENPFLQSYMKAYLNNSLPEQQRQMNQVNANLASSGVRGGQAATLSNRAAGDFNNQLYSNLNQLQFNDAQQKQNQRAQYFSSKANAGQNRKLNPAFGV